MDAMNTQVVHDVSAETIFLRELVKSGAVRDLTGALSWLQKLSMFLKDKQQKTVQRPELKQATFNVTRQ